MPLGSRAGIPTFTGGVSRNQAMVAVMEEFLEMEVNVSEDSHYMGALGAALFARDRTTAGAAGNRAGPAAETRP